MDTLPEQFAAAPKTVRPRKPKPVHYPVIGVADGQAITEDGEVPTIHELTNRLPTMPATMLVANMAARLLADLDHAYATTTTGWQYRVSNNEREITTPTGERFATRVTIAVSYFGWKNRAFHKLLDPVTMYGRSLDVIAPGDQPRAQRLLQWGIQLRDFCYQQGIDPRPTIGAMARQLLTDPRFYPEPRRKVPMATNATAREHLPGNHYRVFVDLKDQEYTGLYLDQTSAHHYHAMHTDMPHSDHLYAYGRFVDLAEICFTRLPERFYGLYCLDLEWQHGAKYSWLPYPENGKLEKQFVYSNELPHLQDMGYRVTGIRAAWGSPFKDDGIKRYAKWARETVAQHENPKWLKLLLLSAYGTLATAPRAAEFVFKDAKRGTPISLPTGGRPLPGLQTKGSKKLEPGICNVLQRGMIEAATRSESIGYAQTLDAQGYRVLAIYADAVIIQDDGANTLPLIPEPWRLKTRLNHLQFLNSQAFIAGEMARLPGYSGGVRQKTLRAHAPRLTPNVAAIMETEENAEALLRPTH